MTASGTTFTALKIPGNARKAVEVVLMDINDGVSGVTARGAIRAVATTTEL